MLLLCFLFASYVSGHVESLSNMSIFNWRSLEVEGFDLFSWLIFALRRKAVFLVNCFWYISTCHLSNKECSEAFVMIKNGCCLKQQFYMYWLALCPWFQFRKQFAMETSKFLFVLLIVSVVLIEAKPTRNDEHQRPQKHVSCSLLLRSQCLNFSP